MLYLSLALGFHAVGLGLAHSGQWLRPKTPQNPTPIEFVNIEPNPAEQAQPSESTLRRAQVDAAASRNLDRDRPLQTSQTSSQTNGAQNSTQNSASTSLPPSLPNASVAPLPQVTPLPPLLSPSPLLSTSPVPRSEARTPMTVPSPAPSSLPVAPSAMPSTPARQPSTTLPPPNPAALPNLAAQLGNPLTASASLEGQGLTGQLNPNRAGDGTSVDAAADEVWGNYLSLLNRAINQNWQRVSVADTRRTRLRFRVDRQGNLAELNLVQPSGDTQADEAAIQAVRAAAPFAPLPQNASEQTLIVNFTFTQWKLAPEP